MIPNQGMLPRSSNHYPVPQYGMQFPFPHFNIPIPFQFRNNFCSFPSLTPCYNRPFVYPPFPDSQMVPFIKIEQRTQDSTSSSESPVLPKFEEISSISLSSKKQISSPVIKLNPDELKTEPEPQLREATIELPNDSEICFEAQVKYLVQYFVNNYGIVLKEDFEKFKVHYNKDIKLRAVFDALENKYSKTSKTREEMIKWIIRRSLKCCQQKMKGDQIQNQKKLLNDLCKKYFKNIQPQSSQNDDDDDDEGDNWIDSVLPFRKNSKNKTMNTAFITELFQSEDFKKDYKYFLKEFDEVAKSENAEKINRFTRMIIECSKKGTLNKIQKYKRVPWLKIWSQNTKFVAFELDKGDFIGKLSKKSKVNN